MTITSDRALSAHAAYEATAEVYDDFTADHDYETWTDMIERLARQHGMASRGRMLDVGCGTGKSFLPWLKRGWSVVGCDQSPSMLGQARRKVPHVPLIEADAREIPNLGRFDLVLALDDVVNYMAPTELHTLFDGAARNLASSGCFVFDLNTIHCYRSFFATTEIREVPGRVVVWRGSATDEFSAGDTATAVLDAFVEYPDGRWRRRHAIHCQHHHPLPAVDAALEQAGLRRIAVYGQDHACNVDLEVDERRHTKAIVIVTHEHVTPAHLDRSLTTTATRTQGGEMKFRESNRRLGPAAAIVKSN